jgi:hypothetical protein
MQHVDVMNNTIFRIGITGQLKRTFASCAHLMMTKEISPYTRQTGQGTVKLIQVERDAVPYRRRLIWDDNDDDIDASKFLLGT